MKEINYIGEHLWAGQLGHAFVSLSFVAALLSTISYFLLSKEKETRQWKLFADISFNLHSVSVLGIAVTLFFMLFNHFYEYSYVWQHSNNSMPMEYILSCFWEGQEGSFLLWTFWNVVLGLLLRYSLKNNTQWQAPVMTVFALVQVFLTSMLMGIYIGDYKLGSDPFIMLRENPDFANLPFVQNPNYLAKLDGRGLNPLLMNYWMVIHPPTLFLGFSSTLIPFAFAIAGMLRKDFTSWQKTALPWTFFGILILGLGILMGGAWAYEALSFGGFWAWDPVENSSLVPWLVLVGAGHVMIINKNKGGSLFTTHLLSVGSFLLVLYSTFLTRSGILGNSSVHAFTDLGMQGQLVIYVLTFILLFVALLIEDRLIQVSYLVFSLLLCFFGALYGYKKILFFIWIGSSIGLSIWSYIKYFPKEKDEEELFSREFWMFIGSLILLLSSIVITYFTSIPVLNKLFNTDKAPIKVADYNLWMIPFAIVIIKIIAISQFLKYKKTDPQKFYKDLKWTSSAAIIFGLVSAIPLYFVKKNENSSVEHETFNHILYTLLLITSLFAVFANGDYWLRILKGRIRHAGASIAHIGFALILLGALISTSKKQTISQNTSKKKVEGLGENFNAQKSLLLTKGDTLPMGPYLVTYTGKERKDIDVYFHIDYFTKGENGQLEKAFSLSPMVQDNPRMGKASNPDTKHFLGRDIYTHVTYGDLSSEEEDPDSYKEPTNFIGHPGDTIFAENAIIRIDSLLTNVSEDQFKSNDSLLVVTAVLNATDIDGKHYFARPKYIIKKNMIVPEEALIAQLGLKFIFWKINPDEGSVEIQMSEKTSNTKEFIVLEAYIFPYINVLWLGCLIMVIGTAIAIKERIRVKKVSVTEHA